MSDKDDYKVTEIDIVLDTDDDTDADREYIERLCIDIQEICNKFIKRHSSIDLCTPMGITEMLKDIGRKHKTDINNIKELNVMWDIYTVICCTCRIKPTILKYCMMVKVNQDTVNSWNRGEFASRVSSGHSESAKRWKAECESNLYDEVIRSGNIGCMFALKANYGYRDNVVVNVQGESRIGQPAMTVEQIEADYPSITDDSDVIDADF